MNLITPKGFRFSLANRLLLFSIALGTIPALLIGLLTVWISVQNLQNDAFAILNTRLEDQEYLIQDWLHNQQAMLSFVLDAPGDRSLLLQVLASDKDAAIEKRNLRTNWQQLLEKTDFLSFMLLDLQGNVLVSTNLTEEGKILKHQGFFTNGLVSDYVSPPFYNPQTNLNLIAFAQPVKDDSQKVQGVFVGLAEVSKLGNLFSGQQILGATGEIYMVGGDFAALTPLKFAETSGVERVFVRTEGAQAAIGARQNGSGIYNNYRGEPVVGAYRWLPDLQAALLAEVDQAEALQGVNAFLRLSLIALAATLIAAVVSGAAIARSISKPVVALAASAQSLAAGDLSRRTNVQRDDEIGLLSQTFDTMAEQLQALITGLEQRVAERTRALETSIQVSRRLSAATSLRQLAVDVVEQVQAAFGYYHAHIYFFDEQKENLIMAGGTGEAGAAMLASGHSIPRGRGLVGRAAETNQSVLVPDVSQSIGWLPNPLLPETKSEAAVPISIGNQVLGVLDVQQNRVNGLDENDVALLEAIAAQVAISYQNARAYEQAQTQAEMEATVNYVNQKIQAATTAEETLQVVLQELPAVLGAQRAAITLQAPTQSTQEVAR